MDITPQQVAFLANQPIPVSPEKKARVRDLDRLATIVEALKQSNLDGIICALPSNVLMLTGYWPVVGSSIAVVTREARVNLLVPADEEMLAENSWADEIFLYRPGSIHNISPPLDVIRQGLMEATRKLHLQRGKLGYEAGYESEPSGYAATHLFSTSIAKILQTLFPSSTIVPADDTLCHLLAHKTPQELTRIRRACEIAKEAFNTGRSSLRAGLMETEAANFFRAPLSTVGTGYDGIVERADGFIYCMSGPNSAQAYGAYARTRARHIVPGDLLLTHCNSFADGFWTDITRTYSFGTPSVERQKMYDAIFRAREAGLMKMKPGICSADVDKVVRETLANAGYAADFKHSTGHGVGFRAFNPQMKPRIHAESPDILEEGSVFNLEPGIYIEGLGGIRHCDMVAVTNGGAELLTDFQTAIDELIIR